MTDGKRSLRTRLRAARLAAAQARGTSGDQRLAADLLDTATAAGLLSPTGRPGEIGPVVVTAYVAANGEPDLAPLRAAVRAAGGQVLLPIPGPERSLAWALDDGRYTPSPDGLPVPVPTTTPLGSGARCLIEQQVTVVFAPALAVDRGGTRMGQGGGFYDTVLAELATSGPSRKATTLAGHPGPPRTPRPLSRAIRVVAVVHDDEVLAIGALPREPHDHAVSAALTPHGLVPLG